MRRMKRGRRPKTNPEQPDGPSGWSRSYWASLHLISATALTRFSFQLESRLLAGESEGVFSQERRACVTGAILTSVAFLEATANELFSDAADVVPGIPGAASSTLMLGRLNGLTADTIQRYRAMWKLSVPRRANYQVLNKFEIALALADKEPFDRGSRVYQEAALLIKLRNSLIHYEPSWAPRGEDKA